MAARFVSFEVNERLLKYSYVFCVKIHLVISKFKITYHMDIKRFAAYVFQRVKTQQKPQ